MSDNSLEPRAWLDSLVNLETGIGVPAGSRRGAPTLERIGTLLKYLGSPEREYPAIHVTGTNGKGSTVAIATQLLVHLGFSVGSFTSPHLERVNERIGYQGDPISDDELDEVLRVVQLVAREVDVRPSYFEAMTAAAFRWFADQAVLGAVVEVGLGGTWDATNVVETAVAVVTNVTIDHVEYLGPTREDIAADKAGIVKPGCTLVLGETDADIASLFLDRGAQRVLRRNVDFGVRANALAVGGRFVELYTANRAYDELFLPLHGAHQADNAAIALAAVEAFVGAPVEYDVVATAFAATRSPGRLEVVGRRPQVLLDGAHNVAGAEALRAALAEEFAAGPRTLVVGLLREKEPREMLAALGVDEAAMLVVCRAPSPRALAPDDIARAARDLGFPEDRIEVVDTVAEAVGAAYLATPEDGQIVVTGSLYTVGAARTMMRR